MRVCVPHPIRNIAHQQRKSIRSIATAAGYSEHWVGQVFLGYQPASEQFRADMCAHFGRPEEELFRPREVEPVVVASSPEIVAAAVQWVERACAAHGVSVDIDDPAILSRVAAILDAPGRDAA